jgi:hypothetical protein
LIIFLSLKNENSLSTRWLEGCIKTGIQQDIFSGLQTISAAYAASEVKTERYKMRATCIQYRQSNHLPIEHN